jgi:hypothetical protein
MAAAGGYSFPYVAGWAGDDPVAAVQATQRRVAQAAKAIIGVSPASHGPGGKVPGADQAIAGARQGSIDAGARRAEIDHRLASGAGPAVA